MKKDDIFTQKLEKEFEFDERVASVFDDMLPRSVPFYKEVIDICIYFILKRAKEGDKVLDLGCSTASLLIELAQKSDVKLNLTGVDNSKAMLDMAKRKVEAFELDIDLIDGDILKLNLPDDNLAVVSNYTLQFVRPIHREELFKKIFDSLKSGGVFIFSEKIITDDKILNKEIIDRYYEFKKLNGYSDLEIIQKREALENVLIPYTEDENKMIARRVGFHSINTVFKWLNFSTFIARKS
jgi:tRNA (cmo5U34)-methyltransferase